MPAQVSGQPLLLAGGSWVGSPGHVAGWHTPSTGDHAPVVLQLLTSCPVKPSAHLVAQAWPTAMPAQLAGHGWLLAGCSWVGVPAHVTCVHEPATLDQLPAALHKLCSWPVYPSAHLVPQVWPAARPAQVAGQPMLLAGGCWVGRLGQVTWLQDPCGDDQAPLLLQVLLTLPV